MAAQTDCFVYTPRVDEFPAPKSEFNAR